MLQTVRWVHRRFGIWVAIVVGAALLAIFAINAIGTVDTVLDVADAEKAHWTRRLATAALSNMGPLDVTPIVNVFIGLSGLILLMVAIVLAGRQEPRKAKPKPLPPEPPSNNAPSASPTNMEKQRQSAGVPVELKWTRDNCSAVFVKNRTLNTFRVWVVLNALKRYSDSAGGFADSELADRLPAELVGGGNEAVPERPVSFPFINTVTRESLGVPLHYPNGQSGNREASIRRKGRWLAQFTVRWADGVVKDYDAEFTWGDDGPVAGAIVARPDANKP